GNFPGPFGAFSCPFSDTPPWTAYSISRRSPAALFIFLRSPFPRRPDRYYNVTMNRPCKPAALAAALVALACCAKAQGQSFSELALDGRPERFERLVAGAKEEGALTLYTS